MAPIGGQESGEEVKPGNITYVKLKETYFQPIKLDGKNKYEIVDEQEAK